MSRWSDLFAALANGVTDNDTPRHSGVSDPPVCHRVSSSVNGSPAADLDINGRWSSRFAELMARTVVVTDNDTPRQTDVSRSVSVCHDNLVFVDFETRNVARCNLKTAGAWRYACDPATEILTLVYQIGAGSHLWTPANGCSDPLRALVLDPNVKFACFAGFEPAIWDSIMVPRFGFAPIPVVRWIDMQAVSSYFALPRALGKLLPVINSPVVKDDGGRRLVLSLSRPNRRTGLYPEITPVVLDRVHQYNRIDVDGLVAVHTALGELPEQERRVWDLDQRINRRGVEIDTAFVRAAKVIAETATGVLLDEFADLTGGLSPYQVSKTRDWLTAHSFSVPDLQEATLEEALDTLTVPPEVRRVVEIRLVTAATSLKKLDAMLACTGLDNRARGLLQYHAATPGRWSGSLLQPQNLPRPTVEIPPDEIESVVAAVKTSDPAALQPWGSPIDVLASALRFAITAAEGCQFGVGDFSAIETCVLLGLAGQHDKCRLLADGVDVYRHMAAQIYGLDRDAFMAIPEEELSLEAAEQRRIGKNTVLGCGYQMGPDRFRRQYLRHLPKDEGETLAERIVYTDYRRTWAPLVPKLWRDLEHTARRAMLHPGVVTVAKCGISYRLDTIAGLPFLICRLLNGKHIHYARATVSREKLDRWGFPVWTYWAYRTGQWREIEPYGGQLAENAVQALARELLVEAMFRFEERDYPVVLTIHDEVVVEHAAVTKDTIENIMSTRPGWAEELGIPVKAKAWVGRRYRK